MDILLALGALGLIVGIMWVTHRLRHSRRQRWLTRDQYHQPQPSAIAAQRAAERAAELDQARREWS